MKDLTESRKIIDEADKEIARLFEARMKAAREIAMYKAEHNLAVFDAAREREVIENNQKYIEDSAVRSYYVLFEKYVMELSRKYQSELMQGKRVAFAGARGAYAEIAARKIFGGATPVPYESFAEAYRSVVEGECECAVLPIENSVAGEVGSNLDMIYEGDLHICGVYELRITHSLLAKKGSSIGDITEVVSHSQALEQCADFIEKHQFTTKNAPNTAMAAKSVAESEDRHIAAIASMETSELYGLEVLECGINAKSDNTTRFAVLARTDAVDASVAKACQSDENVGDCENTSQNPCDGGKNAPKNARNEKTGKENKLFALAFAVKHEAGALAGAISIIAKYGFNMRSIKSRALKDALWQYYFYTEIEGDPESPECVRMLTELEGHCKSIKLLGSYGEHINI